MYAGAWSWLPVPSDWGAQAPIVELRVNACGTVVGRRDREAFDWNGIVWTKFQCDLLGIPGH